MDSSKSIGQDVSAYSLRLVLDSNKSTGGIELTWTKIWLMAMYTITCIELSYRILQTPHLLIV